MVSVEFSFIHFDTSCHLILIVNVNLEQAACVCVCECDECDDVQEYCRIRIYINIYMVLIPSRDRNDVAQHIFFVFLRMYVCVYEYIFIWMRVITA